ncbi:MAG: transcription elongation factor GreA [Acidobacteria bacterium]|nr:transcription elongation factor GreA [Acidobacteriota bacterium]
MPANDKADAGQRIRHKLAEEIAQLERELNYELPKEIAKARAHGDLSENAEYKFAKERQHLVGMRLQQLRSRLADLSLMNLSKIPRDRVGYGSRVTLLDRAKGDELIYQLVTAEESDVGQGLISTTSPIGRALMGRQPGETIEVRTPAGARTFEIVNLATIHDE